MSSIEFLLPGGRIPGRLTSSVLGLSLALSLVSAAQGAMITVNSASDALAPGGACSLRGAIGAINLGANANGCTAIGAYGSGDTIEFGLSPATITFANRIDIQKNLTIDGGSNDITLDGNNASGLLYVSGGTALIVDHLVFKNASDSDRGGAIYIDSLLSSSGGHTLTVRNSTFDDNYAAFFGGAIYGGTVSISDSAFSNNYVAQRGGAIYADGDTTISNSIFSNNRTTENGWYAVYTYGGAIHGMGSVTVDNSVFDGNSSGGSGGAIYTHNSVPNVVTLRNSTFSNNRADSNSGAIRSSFDLVASNSTFVGNQAIVGDAGAIGVSGNFTGDYLTMVNNRGNYYGSAIVMGSGVGTLKNSLIVGDGSVAAALCYIQGSISVSNNIEWRQGIGNETTCGGGSQVLLLPSITMLSQIVETVLADHGGPTPTLNLVAGSPAIDAAAPLPSITTDQRGYMRPAGNAPDVGALEYNALPPGPPGPPSNLDPALTYPVTQAFVASTVDHGIDLRNITGLIAPMPGDIGRDGAVFVFAYLPPSVAVAPDTLWYLDSALNWSLFTDCRATAAYYTGDLQILRGLPIIPTPTDLTLYKGAQLYFGYGLGGYSAPSGSACNDMTARRYYKLVYTVE